MRARSLLVLPLAAGLFPAPARSLDVPKATHPGPPVRAVPAYGDLPLSFEPNRGQADPRVQYLARGRGFTLFLTPKEAVLSLREAAPAAGDLAWRERQAPPHRRRAVLRLSLVGASPTPEPSGADELPGKTHDLVGSDPRRWQRDVPQYARVSYRQVYPGVDLVYHGREGRLEYDFVVSPGSDPGRVRLHVDGATATRLDERRNLVLETPAGRVVQQAPVVYQEVDGERRLVSGSYRLDGGGDVSFSVGPYDRARPLVIDPVLEYSTYVGGSAADWGQAIAIDSSGNAYVTGYTDSADFPEAGAYQPDQAGTDVFVTKLSPSGSSVVYSTYLGGGGDDLGYSIAVDALGNAWVTGRTSSSDFPTMNPYQADQGGVDAFVAKLAPSGASLVYSTYLGGAAQDVATGIVIDAEGSAYVAGYTSSADFPTVNPYQTRQAGVDAFVAKLSPSGTSLSYSTYLGGANEDSAQSLAVDDTGGVVVTGYTYSPDFPVLDPLQPHEADVDAFVTRLAPSGSTLVYSTFLGGDGGDSGVHVVLDGAGNAYVAGCTDSTDFPTVNPYQGPQGVRDAFLSKVSPSGSTLVYSTYLGGAAEDVAFSVSVDAAGNAYVAGWTASANFPTRDEIQGDQPGVDAFLTRFAPSGSSLVYSTYLGGDGADHAFDVAVDGAGSAYVVGDTGSTNFPTENPYQADQPGRDAFVVKLSQTTSLGFFTITPCRVVDTRLSIPLRGGPALTCSPAPPPRTFPITGVCNIPPEAEFITANITVTEGTDPGQLIFYPAASLPPLATTIYYTPDLNRGNNGIYLLGTGHLDVACHQDSGTAHVVIDATGYFAEVTQP